MINTNSIQSEPRFYFNSHMMVQVEPQIQDNELNKYQEGEERWYSMKFLVVGKMSETPPVPPEQLREMVVREWQTGLQLRKEGKTEVSYAFAGLKGGMSKHEAESGADLNTHLMRLPL
jgi:hypothetical protein